MNNEKYNQIIDEAYDKYVRNTPEQHVVGSDSDPMKESMTWKRKTDSLSGYPILERFSKEEFIKKCKTDSEFSERWGLKIEERELDMMERWQIAGLTPNMTEFDYCNKLCNDHNVPTKLLTVIYNNEILDVYE